MRGRSRKRVFAVGGVAWLAVLAALFAGSHRETLDDLAIVGRMDPDAADGRVAYERHHCSACHSVFGIGAGYAPDLTLASKRIGESAIRARLENAERDGRHRTMPRKPLGADEVDALVEYLSWVARVDVRSAPRQYTCDRIAAALRRAAPEPEPGAALVVEKGCLDCHAIGDRGEHRAPRLETIAARDDARFIGQYLADPTRFAPRSSMPPFATATKDERSLLSEFVASLAK